MCGRFTLFADTQAIAEYAASLGGLDGPLPTLSPRYNIAPTQLSWVITEDDGPKATPPKHSVAAKLVLTTMAFGFRPRFLSHNVLNARAETLPEKSIFRRALQHHRCLILASGFYEWQKSPQGGRKPFYFASADSKLFVFAGLYRQTSADDVGHAIAAQEFVIVTTAANSCVSAVHPRMPVILTKEAAAIWLAPTTPPPKAHALLAPFDAAKMTATPVSRQVNRPQTDHPGCIEPCL